MIVAYPDAFGRSLPPQLQKPPEEFLDPQWIDDPENLPFTAQQDTKYVFMAEPDYMFASEKQRGVMFDLWKQLYGCSFLETEELYTEDGRNVLDLDWEELKEIRSVTNTRRFLPNPAQYQWWAWTAHALLNADLETLGARPTYNRNLDGADVSKFINKHGFWGLNAEMEKKKRLTLSRFAPLYARMYNNDPRYKYDLECMKKLEGEGLIESAYDIPSISKVFSTTSDFLHTTTRENPLKFCAVCGVITDLWAINDEGGVGKEIHPGDEDYDDYFVKIRKQVEKKKEEKHARPDQSRYKQENYKVVKLGWDKQRQ